MALAASTIFSSVRAFLDDDNSARYTDAKDLVPAINAAISYLTQVFSAAFETKQIQPDVLAELINIMVLTPAVTGNTARVNLNSHNKFTPYSSYVWRIIGVEPNPTITSLSDAGDPEVLTDIVTESLSRFANRLTIEEWNYAVEDPFAPGTLQTIPSDFQRVCYTGPGRFRDFGVATDTGDGDENVYIWLRPGSLFDVTISPEYNRVAIWFLQKHPAITANTDYVYFPPSVHNFIAQKMIQYLSYQQDSDKFYKVTDKEVKEIISLINGQWQ